MPELARYNGVPQPNYRGHRPKNQWLEIDHVPTRHHWHVRHRIDLARHTEVMFGKNFARAKDAVKFYEKCRAQNLGPRLLIPLGGDSFLCVTGDETYGRLSYYGEPVA